MMILNIVVYNTNQLSSCDFVLSYSSLLLIFIQCYLLLGSMYFSYHLSIYFALLMVSLLKKTEFVFLLFERGWNIYQWIWVTDLDENFITLEFFIIIISLGLVNSNYIPFFLLRWSNFVSWIICVNFCKFSRCQFWWIKNSYNIFLDTDLFWITFADAVSICIHVKVLVSKTLPKGS